MKNKIIVILLAALLVGCFSACAGQAVSPPATVEGAIFGGMSDDRIQTSVVFSPA